ncbi:hypothetical protein E4U54_001790 [Claviceps lovelessii]|nr:hypothetical protein E4U54_001790 [Claviceps lovelessii]
MQREAGGGWSGDEGDEGDEQEGTKPRLELSYRDGDGDGDEDEDEELTHMHIAPPRGCQDTGWATVSQL